MEMTDKIVRFKNERTISDRFAYLGSHLGDGILFLLLPHFTDNDMRNGLSKTSYMCKETLNHLREISLPHRDTNRRLTTAMSTFVDFYTRHFGALLDHIERVEEIHGARRGKRKAPTRGLDTRKRSCN